MIRLFIYETNSVFCICMCFVFFKNVANYVSSVLNLDSVGARSVIWYTTFN